MAITNSAVTNSSAANIYASTGNSVVVTTYICNTTGSAISANLYLVPAAGTAGTSNQIVSSLVIAGNDTYIMNNERVVLANGDMLQANANASGLTATISYTGV